MPTYTYECDECGVRFDAWQRFSDDPITVCPECGGHAHRVPQPVGILFKGSGWYIKDSKGQSSLATPAKHDKDVKDGNGKGSKAEPGVGSTGSSTPDAGTSSSDSGASKED
jgi:putative FmdB family regulatory protein